MLKNLLSSKYSALLILIGASFFVGIWYAFPMLDVVADEMYFVGGVLRAIENHTIVPALGDVPYGVVTYVFNYILIAFSLVWFLVFFKFDVLALKDYLIQAPELVYIIPRFISALFAVGLLIVLNKLLRKEFENVRTRALILIVVFTNLLTTLILHTGKVWVLSTLLLVISFYYLYKAVQHAPYPSLSVNKFIFVSILCSFLATTNFTLFGFTLINIPILLLLFKGNRKIQGKVILYSLASLLISSVFLALTFRDIAILLVNVFTFMNPLLADSPMRENLSIPAELWLNIKKILAFFPLHIALIFLSIKNKIKNKKLFWLAITYFLVYVLFISSVATWPTTMQAFARYMFPVGFILTLIIASLRIKITPAHYVLGTVSVVYFIFAMYFLSVPTTYNLARNWVLENVNYEGAFVENNIHGLELPKNKTSYSLYEEYYCATKCSNTIERDINSDIKYVSVNLRSKKPADISSYDGIYTITSSKLPESENDLVINFSEDFARDFELDKRMANYFDFDFFKIKRFGPDIYVYKKK